VPVVLSRVASTKVYAEPPASGGWLAFLVWTLPSSPAESIDAATAWQQPDYIGYFVMLPAAPASVETFANALQSSPLLQAPTHTSFAWMTYHDASQALALRQVIPVAPGESNRELDSEADSGPDPIVAADTVIPFANYGFTLRAGTRITRNASGDEAFTFHYPAGAEMPPLLSAGLRLPLAGDARACFQAEALINDFTDARDTGFDVACRFYTVNTDGAIARRRYPIFRMPPAGRQYLFALTWDLFEPLDPARTHLTFTRQVYDVVIETPPNPSYIRVVDDGGWMPSVYRTRYGHAIELRPLLSGETTAPARLVFEAVPNADGELRTSNLVPSGDFLMRLAPSARPGEPGPRQQELLCGLAGTEFVRFDFDDVSQLSQASEPTTVMRFHPNQPAFAPRFPLFPRDTAGPVRRARPRIGGGAGDDLLTPQYKTAWLSLGRLTAGPAPTYTSQPQTAPLFRPGPPSSVPLLDHYAPELAHLDHTRVFPMAGYGSSGPRSEQSPPASDLGAFETQILAPVRFDRIGAPLAPLPIDVSTSRHSSGHRADPPFDALTPQGLRVTVENGVWKSIFLAQTIDGDGQASSIAFHDPPPALTSALQSSDLFLVVSNRRQVGRFEGRVVLDGWPFTIDLAPGGGDQSVRNILILKFGKGTLKARASDVDAWTQPNDFSDAPALLASWLRSYIADAEVAAPNEPSLADFVRIVNDEHWNGILAVRVDVDLQAFPPELRGLLGGMDLERFYGHHLGVLQNRPQEDGGQDSSLFALILYRDTSGEPPPPSSDAPSAASPFGVTGVPSSREVAPAHAALMRHARRAHRAIAADDSGAAAYNYRVITLIITFRNSRIEDFESRVILTILRLFGAPAELADSQATFRNSLVFDGSFQRIDGRPSYAFTTSDSYLFQTDSQVVQGVEFVGAEFSTVDDRNGMTIAGIAADTIIRARFQMTGVLAFHAIEGLDLFSFGPPPIDPSTFEGLRFTNLTVQMWFALERPSELHFQLDTSAMTFDTSVSAARADGVFEKLPLKLSRLIVGESGQTPADAGFVDVETPTMEGAAALGGEWYGLVYTLNLGSLGALAEQAGFAAQLLAAWSPALASTGDAAATGPVAAFLNLPGLGPGNNGISLQSVLRLNAAEIRLDRDIDQGVVNYVLSLRDISLSFLGAKLPPSGVTDIALFGSDSQDEGRSSLSWYAAYDAGTGTGAGPGREDA
jgi:hypothetical protein